MQRTVAAIEESKLGAHADVKIADLPDAKEKRFV